ncbi:hypothetical protein MMC21_001331 [Puttea exsequens]|nr:hypothetical protein [Puttea exsequens]
MAPSADPIVSWAVVGLAITGAAYYYSQSGKSRKSRSRRQGTAAEHAQRRESSTRNETKARRKKKAKTGDKSSDPSDQAISDAAEASVELTPASPSEEARRRKKEKSQQQPSKLTLSSTLGESEGQDTGAGLEPQEGEGMSNAEFAKQFSGVRTGTSLKKAATNTETTRTRKQGKRNEMRPETDGTATQPNGVASTQDPSTASSTTGADADDDMSMPVSPAFGATQTTTPAGTDVSDMLEAPEKGPSVLRLTEPANPQSARQPKQHKAPAPVETKKQRQNRQKNEAKKVMREEAEEDRRAALEKHKREQREAEGRPTKNGLGSVQPVKEPKVNQWAKAFGISNFPKYPENTSGDQLLDTFEDVPEAVPEQIQKNAESNDGANGTSTDDKAWENGLPSEEEQMRRISEIDSDNAWTTVPKGKKGKKKVAADDSVNGQ